MSAVLLILGVLWGASTVGVLAIWLWSSVRGHADLPVAGRTAAPLEATPPG